MEEQNSNTNINDYAPYDTSCSDSKHPSLSIIKLWVQVIKRVKKWKIWGVKKNAMPQLNPPPLIRSLVLNLNTENGENLGT